MDDGPAQAGDGVDASLAPVHGLPGGLLVVVSGRRDSLLGCIDTLSVVGDELARLDATILILTDSARDGQATEALAAALDRLRDHVSVDVAPSGDEAPFDRLNRALGAARDAGRDVLLLDPEAVPEPGALAEMTAVARLDPLTAAVVPASDKSPVAETIANGERAGPAEALSAYRAIERHLPRCDYLPVATDGCVLIRRLMLAEFGLLDPDYEGLDRIGELIGRCNWRGYRVVRANHAYVWSGGAARDAAHHPTEGPNRHYPEQNRAIARYLAGPDRHAERVLAGLVPNGRRLRILFDCRVMAPHYNGTLEHMRCLLTAFARQFADRYDIAVLCDRRAFDFHGLDRIDGMHACDEGEALARPAAVAFRLSQPDAATMATICRFGAVTGALMLDTIAMDCLQLDDGDLHRIWSAAAAHLDMIGFNSRFTGDQFRRRFDVPDRTVQFVSLCSTDPADYAPQPAGRASHDGGILLIGNAYPHKHVQEMVAALNAAGSTVPVTSFGIVFDAPGVTAGYASGSVSEDAVNHLYGEAGVALYPSHYEGFGLPIMHALAHRLPVVARDLPCAREIKARCPLGDNIHLCASSEEMAELAMTRPLWIEPSDGAPAAAWTWELAARALADAFEEGLRRFDIMACRRQQAAASSWDEVGRSAAQLSAITRLETGLDLAQRAAHRLDEERHVLETRLADAEARETAARNARLDAEAAEQGERLRATEAGRIADEARAGAATAGEALRRAEAIAADARAATVLAEGRADAAHADALETQRRADAADAATLRAEHRAREAEAAEAKAAGISRALVVAQPNGEVPELPTLAMRLLDWWAARRWPRALMTDVPPPGGSLGDVRLTMTPETLSDPAVRIDFLRWARSIALAGDIRIVRDAGTGGAGEAEAMDDLTALLAMGGLTVKWRARVGGRLVLRAVKTRAWPAFTQSSPYFVDLACLFWLGRPPTDEECDLAEQRLASGAAAADVMLDIAASRPCWQRWRAAFTRGA